MTALVNSAPAAQEVPPSVLRALQAYSAQFEGVVAFDRHYVSRIKYPGHDEQRKVESSRVREGKKIVAVKLHRMTINGNASSSAEIDKEQLIAEKALPYDGGQEFPVGALLAGTRYDSSLPCPCGQDILMFPFHALVKDENHANGILYVDVANGRLVKAAFTPAVLPKPATDGVTTVVFGSGGAGLWDIVQIDERFSGKQMFIKGTFEATIVHEHYRRLTSLEEAKKLLSEFPRV